MNKIAPLLIAALALAGCVQHRWVPGPEVAGDFGRVSGQCKLVAMGGAPGGGFVGAVGNPRVVGAIVGGAILVGAVTTAIQRQNAYNACLEANGFVEADQ